MWYTTRVDTCAHDGCLEYSRTSFVYSFPKTAPTPSAGGLGTKLETEHTNLVQETYSCSHYGYWQVPAPWVRNLESVVFTIVHFQFIAAVGACVQDVGGDYTLLSPSLSLCSVCSLSPA
eukprot:6486495-Amphidinium_carterae.1